MPAELEPEGFCILHFTLDIEEKAAQMRRESAVGTGGRERQAEIVEYIGDRGALLARVATSGRGLSDELKSRVLATFLTLMNLRESLDRAARRPATAGHVAPRSFR